MNANRKIFKEFRGLKSFAISNKALFFLIYFFELLLTGMGRKDSIWRKLPLKNKKSLVRIKENLTMLLRFDDISVLYEIYRENVYSHFELRKNATVIDLGAHVGIFSLMFARSVEKIIAVEPEQNNFGLLQRNIEWNGIKNVFPINIAVGKPSGNMYISNQGKRARTTFSKPGSQFQEVKQQSLDVLIKKLKIKKVDLLKIDTEGAELMIIQNAGKTLAITERIILEVHPWAVSETTVLGELRKHGFIVSQPHPHIFYGKKVGIEK